MVPKLTPILRETGKPKNKKSKLALVALSEIPDVFKVTKELFMPPSKTNDIES